MIPSQKLQRIFRGQCILFLGAGFSLGAKNLSGSPMRSAKELKKRLADELLTETDFDLEQVAELYAETFGSTKLWSTLKEEFTCSSFDLFHKDILSIPWKRIYTTNYDNVIETAASSAGRKVAPVEIEDEISSSSEDVLSVVHLNGSVISGDPSSIDRQLRLTESSFARDELSLTKHYIGLRESLDIHPVALFIGYSIADVDVQRLLFGLGNTKLKCFFVIGENPDKLTEIRAKKFGTAILCNASVFVQWLYSAYSNYDESTNTELQIGAAIEKITISPRVKATDQNVSDFYLLGKFTDDLFSTLSRGVVRRELSERILNSFREECDICILHSALGNGKTVLTQQIAMQAPAFDFEFFEVLNYNQEFTEELQAVLSLKSSKILLIEEYSDWLKAIGYISQFKNSGVKLLLTSRTVAHDLAFERIQRLFEDIRIWEVACDRLSRDECVEMKLLFDEFGLWTTDIADKNDRIKQDSISIDCGAQLHAILISALQAPQMRRRMDEIVEGLSGDEYATNFLIAVCAFAFVQKRGSLRNVYDLLGGNMYGTTISRNRFLSELMDFESGEVLVKSPITAEFILREVFPANRVVDVLVEVVSNCTKIGSASSFASEILKKFMRFSYLERMLSKVGKLKAAETFYEGIKGMGNIRNNYHFWLQYAVACTTLGELDRAQRYFDSAKALAKRYGNDGAEDMIDNHYARYLLELAVAGTETDHFHDLFKSARSIIEDQIRRRRFDVKLKHFPFKTARKYDQFFDRYGHRMTIVQKQEVGRSCGFIARRISELNSEEMRQQYVRDCRKSVEYILDLLAREGLSTQ